MRKPRKSKPLTYAAEAEVRKATEEVLQEHPETLAKLGIEERRTRAKELYNWLGYGAANEKLVGLPCIDQETGEEEYMVAVKAEGDRMWPIALMFIDALKAVERYKPVKE